MRKQPMLQQGQQSTLMNTTFYGYNHNEIISDGEMYDMRNMSDDMFPLLTPRKKRGISSYDVSGQSAVPLNGIMGRDQLVFIRGSDVWYNFIEVSGLHGMISTAANMLPKKIVSFGAYVCIWPDKVYFNTVDQSDCGLMYKDWSLGGSSVSLMMCRGDGTNYDMSTITVSATEPENPTNGKLWIDQSGDNDVLRQYYKPTKEWIEVATTYVKISGTGIGTGLKEYDAVNISGLEAVNTGNTQREKNQVAALNGTMIVFFRGEDYIVVAGLLSKTQDHVKTTNTVRVKLEVPDLDYVCESNNRLWGCKYGLENGSVVNEIRASKLGDFRNWSCFMGLSTDSWTASVGSDGPFTGCATQREYPVFFKENCIHRISGAQPSSFSISTTICRGVQNGSWRSVRVVNEAIYYKSREDVMVYDGSMPTSISYALGDIIYYDARAGALGDRYYISMKDKNNHWFMFNYDTSHKTWHKEDFTRALGFGAADDDLYFIDEDNNTLVSVRGLKGTAEPDFEWAAEFGLYGTDYSTQGMNDTPTRTRNAKYLSMFKIRMYLEPGAYMKLWIKYDDDPLYTYIGERRGNSMRSFILPVIPKRCDHMRFKITGKGEARIYSISRIMEVGGDGI